MDLRYFNDEWKKLNADEKKEYLAIKFDHQNFKIIYLDDEADHLEIFKDECENLGINCVLFTKPEEMLSYLEKNKSKVFLIISDYLMPEMDGFVFREKVLDICPEVPFVILTGMLTKEMALTGIEKKIAAFLEKPYNSELLINILTGVGEARVAQLMEEWDMLKGFVEDATNLTEKIEALCMDIEEDRTHVSNNVSMIFGMVHTIKGSSGFFSPRTLHTFAHHFEDSLKKVQNSSYLVSSNLVSSWLKANDQLKLLIKELMSGDHHEYDLENFKNLFAVSDNTISNNKVSGEVPEDKVSAVNAKISQTKDLKVSMELLDDFMRTSGELTVIRNIINRAVKTLEVQYPGDKDVGALSELFVEMHKINSDIQNKIADIRCVSVKQITKPLVRAVRDTAKALGKDVDFEIEGEELRLDNSIIELFSICLIHMIRNALDHGIEENALRIQNKKDPKGKIKLKFDIKDDKVIVTLSDNGKGLSQAKIKEKALLQKLKTPQEISKISPSELYLLIFESGFSTAEVVTEFSGRGVGMSMVKEKIYEAGGEIRIQSIEGEGSEFTMVVPLPSSVLITNSLFVKTAGMTLALPQAHILRVFDLKKSGPELVEHVQGGDILRFENHLLPVSSMANLLKVETAERNEENYLLVLEVKKKKFVIKVNEVLDIEDIVIKPLNVQGLDQNGLFQGATFLSDGKVGLVISVEGLCKSLNLQDVKIVQKEQLATNEAKNIERVLVFSLEQQGVYAIKESEIIRIESFDKIKIKISGNNWVAPYREGLINLISLDNEIFNYSQCLELFADEIKVLIVPSNETNGCPIGIIVKEILDLDSVEFNIQAPLKKVKGILGNIVYKDAALSLIDIKNIKNLNIFDEREESKLDLFRTVA